MQNATIEIWTDGICRIESQEYPAIGFGTYPFKGDVCTRAVEAALATGYRIIDTATVYGNLEAVGEAIKSYERKRLYLISKVWPDAQHRAGMQADIQQTLKQLGTDYLDAYFLHWPDSRIPIEESLNAMAELKQQGMIRHIGVSNFTVNHLTRALEVGVSITWLQVEMSAFFYDPKLLPFCHERGIAVQAWRPLGFGKAAELPHLLQLADKYGKTPSEIAIRWVIQHAALPLVGSQNVQHMDENLGSVSEFVIEPSDMQLIDGAAASGKRRRIVPADNAGFNDEFDYTYAQCWPK